MAATHLPFSTAGSVHRTFRKTPRDRYTFHLRQAGYRSWGILHGMCSFFAYAQLSDAPLEKVFQRLEALCREVVVAVTGEAEVDQFLELLTLIGHEPGTRADTTVQPLRPQVEGDHLRIVLFEDEFHCQHRIFAGSRIFPRGEHDTQKHSNILIQT